MKAYKFVIPTDSFVTVPSVPGKCEVKGCAAIVIADSAVEARRLLHVDLASHRNVPWDEVVAEPVELPLDVPAVLIVVQ